jgi:hypothetical protein
MRSSGPVERTRLPREWRVNALLEPAAGEEMVERPARGGVADDEDPPPVEPHEVSDETANPLDHLPIALTARERRRDESRTWRKLLD